MKKKSPAKKATRKPARKKHRLRSSHAKPKIHVYPEDCFVVETRVHAPAHANGGYVTFISSRACTLDFDDGSIFGLSAPGTPGSLDLDSGNTKVYIEVENGTFSYSIRGCLAAAPKLKSGEAIVAFDVVAADPKDIIVP